MTNIDELQLACPCCGTCDLDRRLVPALEELVERARPHEVVILCGCRCSQQSGETRSVSKLAHLQGRAADLRITDLTLPEMYDLAASVDAFFNGGIGVHDDGSMHVDVRALPARWARVAGRYVGLKNSGLLEEVKA